MHRGGGQGGNTSTHHLISAARVFTPEELQVHLRTPSPLVTAVRGQAEQEGGHPTLRDGKGPQGGQEAELRGHTVMSWLSV